MQGEAEAVLLQYGALGAIAVFAIFGVGWYGRGARKDMQRMLEINQQNHQEYSQATALAQKEFTDYLKQQANQAYTTNAAFVEAIGDLRMSLDETNGRIDKWLGRHTGGV
jgi:hypothetical protein